MPEYSAPGAYTEEISHRARTIAPVATGVAGFVGATCAGPRDGSPALVTSLEEFERIHDGDEASGINGGNGAGGDFMRHAVRAFFEEGGARCYVASISTVGVSSGEAKTTPLATIEGGTDAYVLGLKALEAIDEVAIVAAPGSSAHPRDAAAIAAALINHAERMRCRIALIDSVPRHSIDAVLAYRRAFDSSHAAFYYPWVRIVDPSSGLEALHPPSGFVAGIFARSDANRGVHKPPANEIVGLATGFEATLTKAQQDVLNPEGINCFRYFEGRGRRLWGARTMSSDPEWKYVNIRRYISYLEHAIDLGTRWVVFESNGETLWAGVRRSIEDFLLNEWRSGALLAATSDEAYFVRCDQTTMTQADVAGGRLVCLVGVAPIKPAEFIMLRVDLRTAGAQT